MTSGSCSIRLNTLKTLALSALLVGSVATATGQDIAPSAQRQIAALLAEKASRTPAQAKIDSHLLHAAMVASGRPLNPALPPLEAELKVVRADARNMAQVDISGAVSDGLLAAIRSVGGRIVSSFPEHESVRAWVPLTRLENIAARPEVRQIAMADYPQLSGSIGLEAVRERLSSYMKSRSAMPAFGIGGLIPALNAGFQLANPAPPAVAGAAGDTAHAAGAIRSQYGFDGTGVKIAVISNGVDSLAAEQAANRLPSNVTVVPGQATDVSGSSCTDGAAGNTCDEGTAMLEIVHALAPGASLYFVTAAGGSAQTAANIRALSDYYGCNIIVDDIVFSSEAVFQDDKLANAINYVTSKGVLYFSSAGNFGNLLNGKSGTWRGDFMSSGSNLTGTVGGAAYSATMNSFNGATYNQLNKLGSWVSLQWSDPLGGSNNDYDLFILNGTGTSVIASSLNTQSGTQDPKEFINSTSYSGSCGTGLCRIVIGNYNNTAAVRTLFLSTAGGALSVGTKGATTGHNAAEAAITVAAAPAYCDASGNCVPFSSSVLNSLVSQNYLGAVEPYSSDGPRIVYYQPDGTPYTSGQLTIASNGGRTLSKPDLTAADCVRTGIILYAGQTDPYVFCGTSAAAPHAAAIAALMMQARPALTKGDVLAAGNMLALSGTPTWNENAGMGILMADRAITSSCTYSVNGGSVPSPVPAGGGTYSLSVNATAGCTWTINASPWITLAARSGSGSQSVSLTVAPNNTGGGRTGSVAVANASLSIVQSTSQAGPLTVATASALSAFVGGAYSMPLTATGGTLPYTWSISGGSLPPGVTIGGGDNDQLKGTPTTAGTYNFTVQVRDGAGATATKQLSIVVIAGPSGSMPRAGVVAQLAAGGSWDSEMWVANNSSTDVPVRIKFYGDDGSAGLNTPFQATTEGLTFNNSALPASIDFVLKAHGASVIKTTGGSLPNVQGWAEVLSSGTALTGFCIFRSTSLGEGITPLQTQTGPTTLTMPFDNSATTGLALGNVGSGTATITVSAWYQDGNPIPGLTNATVIYKEGDSKQSNTWAANSHDAFMLPTKFPATAGQKGVIQFKISSGGALTGVGLRVGSVGTLTTFTSVPTTLQ